MYNCNVPDNNSLKAEIEELLEWCEKNDIEDECQGSYFEEPIEESKMSKWEEENNVKIPESYKEWLRFSRKCRIDGTTATFWGPDEFHSEYVPEDFVVIGEMVGDGEVVCFSKSKGEFVEYFEGRVWGKHYSNFSEVLKEVLRMMGKIEITEKDKEEVKEMLRKLEEIRKKEEQEG